MQKKKIHKPSKVAKFSPEDLPSVFFENIMDDMTTDHFDVDNSLEQMVSSVMNASVELSKLVIENRVRNTDRMVDEDIHEIYKKSFMTVLQVNSDMNNQ